jgi:CRP-like cAMP-binding protein
MKAMSDALRDAQWLLGRLGHHDLTDVSDAALAALATSVERQVLPRGQLLYAEGTIPSGAWAIRSGRVDLSSRVGGKRSIVQILRAGAIAGDLPILLSSPSLSTAHVGEEGTFLFLEAGTLRSLLEAHAELAFQWLHNVAAELKEARIRILQLLGADLPQSIARVLLNEETEGRIALTQLAIAELLGVERTSVNRVLGSLRESGILDLSYGSVTIRDRSELTRIAAGDGEDWLASDREPGVEQAG